MALPTDIDNLIFRYSVQPTSQFPDWIKEEHHARLVAYMGSNPRAGYLIAKYYKTNPSIEYGATIDFINLLKSNNELLSENPSGQVIELLKTNPELVHISGLIRNKSSDPWIFDKITEEINKMEKQLQIANYIDILKYSPNPQLIEWVTNKKAIVIGFLSQNENERAIEYLSNNKHWINLEKLASNPADEAIELLKTLSEQELETCTTYLLANPNPKVLELFFDTPWLTLKKTNIELSDEFDRLWRELEGASEAGRKIHLDKLKKFYGVMKPIPIYRAYEDNSPLYTFISCSKILDNVHFISLGAFAMTDSDFSRFIKWLFKIHAIIPSDLDQCTSEQIIKYMGSNPDDVVFSNPYNRLCENSICLDQVARNNKYLLKNYSDVSKKVKYVIKNLFIG